MREVLVTDLVADVLGPRGGHMEEIKDSPMTEYVTGILAPVGGGPVEDESGMRDSEIGEESGSFEGDSADSGTGVTPLLSPVLDPQKAPPTMGMTFYVEFDGELRLDICATWARYTKSESGWRRSPRHAVFPMNGDGGTVWLDGDGHRTKREDAEVSVDMRCKISGRRATTSTYMVNRIRVGKDNRINAENHIFQPQIRIVCPKGVRLIPKPPSDTATDDEAEFEILYADRKALGRGHMTSVVWKEIDPEIIRDGTDLDYPECLKRPGFAWVDGEALPEPDRGRFSRADIRTEFVPMYSVLAPDVEYWPEDSKRPRLEAKFYSEQYDPAGLRDALEPFDTAYRVWVEKLENMPAGNDDVRNRIIGRAKEAHRRIKGGIDFLCGNDDARLAFCFASRAIYQQAEWSKGGGEFTFRPFQMGFVLLSAESTLNPDSRERGVCDLLWVPTGTGKTEAYLFLVAMTAAYRRLRAQKRRIKDRSGAGVSVISRYTLRLLAIQQFRRTLSLFVAMEYLRVDGLGNGTRVGWRPDGFPSDQNFLWGTARFSVGLWIGAGVTPNMLEDRYVDSKRILGALSILEDRRISSTSEPAQILDCPVCGTILSLPQEDGPQGTLTLHYIVKVKRGDTLASGMQGYAEADIGVSGIRNVKVGMVKNHGAFFTLTVTLEAANPLTHTGLAALCDGIQRRAKERQIEFEYVSIRSRPGYFIKTYGNRNRRYDFEVFCPNGKCALNVRWAAGAPCGNANGSTSGIETPTDTVRDIESPDDNRFVGVNAAFEIEPHVADRIPIPAFTVDEQVYAHIPTMVVATVDKFARMPFEARASQLFGNADHHHHIRGYYREAEGGHPDPHGAKNHMRLDRRMEPPDLIIQDELHLLDGSLGSMTGIYETAIDRLASASKHPIKYVASTATIRRADSHVQALFSRKLMIFPPRGMSADDRFFVKEQTASPLCENRPGRLYVGICAPGKGPLTPIVHIWARLACSLHNNADDPHIDKYWTVTGYFNTVRELAAARSLYRQNIPERMDRFLVHGHSRNFGEDRLIELSGRTQSTSLPAYLKRLEETSKDAGPDALFTTSMFGTGVDVSKMSTMIVNGQPKTSSSYIQATGRVGRSRGAMVVTFYKTTMPRDLNHYEFFCRHHMHLHRFVEPPTAFPFAVGVMENAMGPVTVSILRNGGGTGRWAPLDSAPIMESNSDSDEVRSIKELLRNRAAGQPESKRPAVDDVDRTIKSRIALWHRAAANHPDDLIYYEYGKAKHNVVLGDPLHSALAKSTVYDNVPQSLRDVEEETEFEA